jgi:hypothetical protein
VASTTEPNRIVDAAIGVCGIFVRFEVSGWADMRVTFLNGHGVGFRGFLAERGLVLAGCVAVAVVGARPCTTPKEGQHITVGRLR